MRTFVLTALWLPLAITACTGRKSQRETVDTAMVFVAKPVPSSWSDSIMSVVDEYAAKRISADSAAKMMVAIANGRSLNLEMDEPLLAAVQREVHKRNH